MAFNSYKKDENTVTAGKAATLSRLFSYLLSYKKQIVGVLFIMGFCVVVNLLNPLIMEAAVDDYISAGNFPGLLRLILFAVVINLLMVAGIKIRMYVMAKVCNSILVTIRRELYVHIQTLDFQFFDSRPTGKILARIIGDINSLKDVLSNCVTTLIPDFITISAVAVIMFVKDVRLAAAALVSLPLMAAGIWYIQTHSHERWQIHRKKSSNLNAFVHEDLSGIRIIQSFGAEEETMDTFRDLTKQHRDSFVNAVRSMTPWARSSTCAGPSACFPCILWESWCSAGPGIRGNLPGVRNLYFHVLEPDHEPEQLLQPDDHQHRRRGAGFEIMDTPPAITDGEGVKELPPIQGEVVFDHVSFSYDEAAKVLNDVSFRIRPGETIALVGPTGAGKTTIVNLISRFYDIQQGHVYIDGHDVKEVSIESLRRQMGIMTQDNFLFSGTIRDNIRYGKLDATDEEIVAAAKAVNAHDFIMRLDKGYDTELSERGGGLSIGQKQLLAFARTMVSDPAILILDEATSSIDTKTELLVQEGIEHLLAGRTSFVIAHRLSTIQKADRIFVIDNGTIAEEGNAAQLMEKKGAYYHLYMSQFKNVM